MVTDKELSVIQRKVNLSGLSHREFILRCILGKDIHVKHGGHEVVIELKRIGNNLNQLTYNVNVGLIWDCKPELQSIYTELQEVRKIWQ